jgi:hypothetical protein
MKAFMVFISIFLGSVSSSGLFSKYWLPPQVRKYVLTPKFAAGTCLSSKRWGVNPKVVIGHKEGQKFSNYLLKDHDRYEHMQYISSDNVEQFAVKVSCR